MKIDVKSAAALVIFCFVSLKPNRFVKPVRFRTKSQTFPNP